MSWYCVTEDTRQTLIHCYQMATDYQTVDTVRELQNVDHYVSSLHNILGKNRVYVLIGFGHSVDAYFFLFDRMR